MLQGKLCGYIEVLISTAEEAELKAKGSQTFGQKVRSLSKIVRKTSAAKGPSAADLQARVAADTAPQTAAKPLKAGCCSVS